MSDVVDLVSCLELKSVVDAAAKEDGLSGLYFDDRADDDDDDDDGDDDDGDDADGSVAADEEQRLLEAETSAVGALERRLLEVERAAEEMERLSNELLQQVDTLSDLPHQCSSYVTQGTADGATDDEAYVVKQILGKKSGGGVVKYLCVWTPGDGLTWEAEADIEQIALVESYEGRMREKWAAVVQRHNAEKRGRFLQRASASASARRPKLSKKKQQKLREKEARQQGGQGGHGGAGGGGGDNNNGNVVYDQQGNRHTVVRNITMTEEERLMHLDVPELRRYLQTVENFTPLHYNLLLRLSEEDVPRGASDIALSRVAVPTSEQFAAHKDDCIVCMDPCEEQVEAAYLPCGHIFHDDCIRGWFKNEKTCPLCKAEL